MQKNADISDDPRKLEFGQRLQSLILDKGWSQSDLARAAGLGRDSISTYIRGIVFPDPKNLRKIADALGVSVQQLTPTQNDGGFPALEITQSSTDPNKVHIRINRLVTLDQAAKIFAILNIT